MKKVNKDPFSNGTEYMMFEDLCCNKCVKHSHMKKEGDTMYEDEYTKIVCSIERDIFIRMGSNEPINQRTVDVCYDFVMHGKLCPYMKTGRKRYPKKKAKQDKRQTELEL